MEKIGIESIIFISGVIIFIIGLFGRLETKWFKIGSDNFVIKSVAILIGIIFIAISLISSDYFSGKIFKFESRIKNFEQKLSEEKKMALIKEDKISKLERTINSQKSEISECKDDLKDIRLEYKRAQEQTKKLNQKPSIKIPIKGNWDMKTEGWIFSLEIEEQDPSLFQGKMFEHKRNIVSYVWGSISAQNIEFMRVARPSGTVQEFKGKISNDGKRMDGTFCHLDRCDYPWEASRY